MAFVPISSFIPQWRTRVKPNAVTARRPPVIMAVSDMNIADGMDFFRYREGEWESWRVTHHLAFRRSESGESVISMKCLEPTDERIVNLCKDWKVEPMETQGGCFVTWRATLDWDQEGENHEGETVFALVPEADDKRRGRILRDRGYAEVVPIAGTYYLDGENDLNLETPYEGGAVVEKFSFDGPNIVNRLSTVKRFGGYSTATFATERRVGAETISTDCEEDDEELFEILDFVQFLATPPEDDDKVQSDSKSTYVRKSRWAAIDQGGKTPASSVFSTGFNSKNSKPSPSSAFGSGFSRGNGSGSAPDKAVQKSMDSSSMDQKPKTEVTAQDVNNGIQELAAKAGIDLSKIPPSMRDDFLATFEDESKGNSGK